MFYFNETTIVFKMLSENRLLLRRGSTIDITPAYFRPDPRPYHRLPQILR